MPDKAFDLAIVDPPYGIGINNNMGRRKGDKASEYKKVSWDSSPPKMNILTSFLGLLKIKLYGEQTILLCHQQSVL